MNSKSKQEGSSGAIIIIIKAVRIHPIRWPNSSLFQEQGRRKKRTNDRHHKRSGLPMTKYQLTWIEPEGYSDDKVKTWVRIIISHPTKI